MNMSFSVSQVLLSLHIAAGVISLFLFWIPLITKKGKNAHRQMGKIYVYCMYTVVATAYVLSVIRLSTGNIEQGAALFFLAALTTQPLLSGVQVLKVKKPKPWYRILRLSLGGLLLTTGVALMIGWQLLDSGLLLAFGLIGMVAGASDIRRFMKPTSAGPNWLREHYEGMLFSGGAAYTAFLAFGGSTWLSDYITGWWTLVPWLLPTLLTMALIPLVHKRCKQNRRVTA